MASNPEKLNLVRGGLWVFYDLLWITFGTLVYGVSLLPACALCSWAYERFGLVGAAFSILPAYVLSLLGVILIISAIRLISPRLQPGIYQKFSRGQFFTLVWLTGLNNIVFAMPFTRTINFLAVLRYLYYRGQGLQTYFMNWISVDAALMDPALIKLGKRVNVGGMVGMSCHLGLPDHMVILPITVGDDVIIGAASRVAPGVEIGDRALIGACAALGLSVKVGEGAQIEPASWVASKTVIGPYEKWGGNPAVKIGDLPRPRASRSEEESRT